MTTVPNMEALNELPEGEEIAVRSRQLGNQRWTKQASGLFAREEVLVGAEFFVGYLADGRVVRYDNTPAGPGDWFTANRQDYLLVAPVEGGLHSMTFYDGRWRSDNVYTANTFDPVRVGTTISRASGPPDRVLANPDSMRRIWEEYVDRLASALTRAEQAEKRAEKAEKKQPTPPPPTPERETVVVRATGVDLRVDVETLDEEPSTVVFGPGPTSEQPF